jgi:hypothetical protein
VAVAVEALETYVVGRKVVLYGPGVERTDGRIVG